MKIKELEPKEIFKYFDEILQIPRPSKKEEKIIAYMKEFAQTNKLEYKIDEIGNVLIIREASKGMENKKTVIIQSHLDMVPEKRTDLEHNFETDPIKAFVDTDGWIKTNGTTLGGDDGIGIAAAMAILVAKDLQLPKIEALFTVDEETGMTGAFGIKDGFMEGKILINLDSEDEGELFIGSAGGIDTVAIFNYTKEPVNENDIAIEISIDKLHGGHSGDEIHKGYGNSIQLINRILWNTYQEIGLRLSTFEGGKLRNAIPKDAKAIFTIEKEKFNKFKVLFEKQKTNFINEYGIVEPNMELEFKQVNFPDFIIDKATQYSLIWSIYAAPHGEQVWDKQMDDLVQTSTNLATLNYIGDNQIRIGTSQRSSIDSSKMNIATKVRTVFELAGADVSHGEPYPGWKPNTDSEILKITETAYEKLFNKKPIVRAIHAGLECGLFLQKYPYLDMISFGPTIKGAHTPEEKMDIKTVEMFWDLLVEVLINTPE
ncbi:MAG: aminoacyl-histidine dipeptidase [Bacteroidales bacterium]|nr:aminoacyl-histidine dipeptidase [Bacteroidales bacterium]